MRYHEMFTLLWLLVLTMKCSMHVKCSQLQWQGRLVLGYAKQLCSVLYKIGLILSKRKCVAKVFGVFHHHHPPHRTNFWHRQLVCTTRGGVCNALFAIVITDFRSFFLLCLLLLTHFGETSEAKILFPPIF